MLKVALLVTAVSAVIILLKAFAEKASSATSSDYIAAEALVTAAELSFLKALDTAAGPQRRVLTKVRLADVIQPKPTLDTSKKTIAKNRIIQKQLDFVICNATSLEILGVVELNDASHRRPDRIARDQFLTTAMQAADIPLIFVKAARAYSIPQLKETLSSAGLPPTA